MVIFVTGGPQCTHFEFFKPKRGKLGLAQGPPWGKKKPAGPDPTRRDKTVFVRRRPGGGGGEGVGSTGDKLFLLATLLDFFCAGNFAFFFPRARTGVWAVGGGGKRGGGGAAAKGAGGWGGRRIKLLDWLILWQVGGGVSFAGFPCRHFYVRR